MIKSNLKTMMHMCAVIACSAYDDASAMNGGKSNQLQKIAFQKLESTVNMKLNVNIYMPAFSDEIKQAAEKFITSHNAIITQFSTQLDNTFVNFLNSIMKINDPLFKKCVDSSNCGYYCTKSIISSMIGKDILNNNSLLKISFLYACTYGMCAKDNRTQLIKEFKNIYVDNFEMIIESLRNNFTAYRDSLSAPLDFSISAFLDEIK